MSPRDAKSFWAGDRKYWQACETETIPVKTARHRSDTITTEPREGRDHLQAF